jgi:cobalt-zinc-cadmium efflux system protein
MGTTHVHSHANEAANMTVRRLSLALIITLGFVFIEATAGWYSNSLALLTDAAHNFTDVIALALSWHAIWLAARPANANRTFGYHRAGILMALFNSSTLALIALGIFYEAYQRLIAPPQVEASILIVVAAIAFIVNAGTALLVKQGSENDLNMRAAFVHLAGDAVSTFGAILAGIGIALTGIEALDPIISILIGLLILWNAWAIIRESAEILLESTPRNVDMHALVDDLTGISHVRGVHDLHVWSITASLRALSTHVLIDDVPINTRVSTQHAINEMLQHKYNITHITLQLECVGCEPELLYCDLTANHQH